MSKIQVHREHEIHCGHRVVGHEGKCRHLHGHGYVIHFTCEAENGQLDHIGRVIDFSEVKTRLCMWLEDNWDHKTLLWKADKIWDIIESHIHSTEGFVSSDTFTDSFVEVDFNPTAENMAQYLVDVIGPQQLEGTGIKLVSVTIEETRKCSVSYGI